MSATRSSLPNDETTLTKMHPSSLFQLLPNLFLSSDERVPCHPKTIYEAPYGIHFIVSGLESRSQRKNLKMRLKNIIFNSLGFAMM